MNPKQDPGYFQTLLRLHQIRKKEVNDNWRTLVQSAIDNIPEDTELTWKSDFSIRDVFSLLKETNSDTDAAGLYMLLRKLMCSPKLLAALSEKKNEDLPLFLAYQSGSPLQVTWNLTCIFNMIECGFITTTNQTAILKAESANKTLLNNNRTFHVILQLTMDSAKNHKDPETLSLCLSLLLSVFCWRTISTDFSVMVTLSNLFSIVFLFFLRLAKPPFHETNDGHPAVGIEEDSYPYTNRLQALTLIRHLLLFQTPRNVQKLQKMAYFSGILPLFYIEAFSPIPEPRQSSEVHLHDCYRDICFLLTHHSFVSDLLKSIPESLIEPCTLPAPAHPTQLNRMHTYLPYLSDASNPLQPSAATHPLLMSAKHPFFNNNPTGFPPAFPLLNPIQYTQPLSTPQKPLPKLTPSQLWHEPNYLLSPFFLSPASLYSLSSPYFFYINMSPSASSSIHFLPQFRHNTTKPPNSNIKQKAETILGGLPIKPWVLTDKEQIARERSCSYHALIRFADSIVLHTAVASFGVRELKRRYALQFQEPQTRNFLEQLVKSSEGLANPYLPVRQDGAPQASPPNVQTPSHKLPHAHSVPLLKAPFSVQHGPRASLSINKLDTTIPFCTEPPSISLDGSGRDLSDVSNLVDWLIVLKEMKLKPSLVKKAGIETTQARNHSFGSMHLDEIAEVVLDRLRREREAQAYQNGMAKKVGEEDDDVDNLIEFLALTGGRSEEDALLTVLKDKTGQPVLAKVGSGKSEDIMQSIFRPREHTSLEKEDKHKGRSDASLKNSGNMIDFQDSANNTIQQSPFLPINVGAFWCLYDSSFVTPRLIWGETDREEVRKEAKQAFWSWTERRRNEEQADRDKSNKKTRHSSKLTPPPQSPLTSPLSERRARQTTPFRTANAPSVITTMITPSVASTSAAVSFENPHRLVALPSRSTVKTRQFFYPSPLARTLFPMVNAKLVVIATNVTAESGQKMSTLHSGTLGGKGAAGGLRRRQETNDAALFFLTPPVLLYSAGMGKEEKKENVEEGETVTEETKLVEASSDTMNDDNPLTRRFSRLVSTPTALATLRGLPQLTIPATTGSKGLPSSFLPSVLHSLLFVKVDDIYADHLFIEYQPALYLSTNASKNSKKRKDETKRPSALPAKRVSVLAGKKEEQEEGDRLHPFDDASSALSLLYSLANPSKFVQSLISRLLANVDTLKSLHEMLVTGELVDEETRLQESSSNNADIFAFPLLPFKIEEEGQSEKLKQEMYSLSVCSLLCHLLACVIRLYPPTRQHFTASFFVRLLSQCLLFFSHLSSNHIDLKLSHSSLSEFSARLLRNASSGRESNTILERSFLELHPLLFLISAQFANIVIALVSILHTLLSAPTSFLPDFVEGGGIGILLAALHLVPILVSIFPSVLPHSPPVHVQQRCTNIVNLPSNATFNNPLPTTLGSSGTTPSLGSDVHSSQSFLKSSHSSHRLTSLNPHKLDAITRLPSPRISSTLLHPISSFSALLLFQSLRSYLSFYHLNKGFPASIGRHSILSRGEQRKQEAALSLTNYTLRLFSISFSLFCPSLSSFDPSLVPDWTLLSRFFFRQLCSNSSGGDAMFVKELFDQYETGEQTFLKKRTELHSELVMLKKTLKNHETQVASLEEVFEPAWRVKEENWKDERKRYTQVLRELVQSDGKNLSDKESEKKDSAGCHCHICTRIRKLEKTDEKMRRGFSMFVSEMKDQFAEIRDSGDWKERGRWMREDDSAMDVFNVSSKSGEDGGSVKMRTDLCASSSWQHALPGSELPSATPTSFFSMTLPLFDRSSPVHASLLSFISSSALPLSLAVEVVLDDDDWRDGGDDDQNPEEPDEENDMDKELLLEYDFLDVSVAEGEKKSAWPKNQLKSPNVLSPTSPLLHSSPLPTPQPSPPSQLGVLSRTGSESALQGDSPLIDNTMLEQDFFDRKMAPSITNSFLFGTEWGDGSADGRADAVSPLFAFFPLSQIHTTPDLFSSGLLPVEIMEKSLDGVNETRRGLFETWKAAQLPITNLGHSDKDVTFKVSSSETVPHPIGRFQLFFQRPDVSSLGMLLVSCISHLVSVCPNAFFVLNLDSTELNSHTMRDPLLLTAFLPLYLLPLPHLHSHLSALMFSFLINTFSCISTTLEQPTLSKLHLPLFILYSFRFAAPLSSIVLLKTCLLLSLRSHALSRVKTTHYHPTLFSDSVTLNELISTSYSTDSFDLATFVSFFEGQEKDEILSCLPPSLVRLLFVCKEERGSQGYSWNGGGPREWEKDIDVRKSSDDVDISVCLCEHNFPQFRTCRSALLSSSIFPSSLLNTEDVTIPVLHLSSLIRFGRCFNLHSPLLSYHSLNTNTFCPIWTAEMNRTLQTTLDSLFDPFFTSLPSEQAAIAFRSLTPSLITHPSKQAKDLEETKAFFRPILKVESIEDWWMNGTYWTEMKSKGLQPEPSFNSLKPSLAVPHPPFCLIAYEESKFVSNAGFSVSDSSSGLISHSILFVDAFLPNTHGIVMSTLTQLLVSLKEDSVVSPIPLPLFFLPFHVPPQDRRASDAVSLTQSFAQSLPRNNRLFSFPSWPSLAPHSLFSTRHKALSSSFTSSQAHSFFLFQSSFPILALLDSKGYRMVAALNGRETGMRRDQPGKNRLENVVVEMSKVIETIVLHDHLASPIEWKERQKEGVGDLDIVVGLVEDDEESQMDDSVTVSSYPPTFFSSSPSTVLLASSLLKTITLVLVSNPFLPFILSTPLTHHSSQLTASPFASNSPSVAMPLNSKAVPPAFNLQFLLHALSLILIHYEVGMEGSEMKKKSKKKDVDVPPFPRVLAPLLTVLSSLLSSSLLLSSPPFSSPSHPLTEFIEMRGLVLLHRVYATIISPAIASYASLSCSKKASPAGLPLISVTPALPSFISTSPSPHESTASLFSAIFPASVNESFAAILQIGILCTDHLTQLQLHAIRLETMGGGRDFFSNGQWDEKDKSRLSFSCWESSTAESGMNSARSTRQLSTEGRDEKSSEKKAQSLTVTDMKQTHIVLFGQILADCLVHCLVAVLELISAHRDESYPTLLACSLLLPNVPHSLPVPFLPLSQNIQNCFKEKSPKDIPHTIPYPLVILIHLALASLLHLFNSTFHATTTSLTKSHKRVGTMALTEELLGEVRNQKMTDSTEPKKVNREIEAIEAGASSSAVLYALVMGENLLPLLLLFMMVMPASFPVPEYPTQPPFDLPSLFPSVFSGPSSNFSFHTTATESRGGGSVMSAQAILTMEGLSSLGIQPTSSLLSLEAGKVIFALLKCNKTAFERSLTHLHIESGDHLLSDSLEATLPEEILKYMPSTVFSPVSILTALKSQLVSSPPIFYAWKAYTDEKTIVDEQIKRGEKTQDADRFEIVGDSLADYPSIEGAVTEPDAESVVAKGPEKLETSHSMVYSREAFQKQLLKESKSVLSRSAPFGVEEKRLDPHEKKMLYQQEQRRIEERAKDERRRKMDRILEAAGLEGGKEVGKVKGSLLEGEDTSRKWILHKEQILDELFKIVAHLGSKKRKGLLGKHKSKKKELVDLLDVELVEHLVGENKERERVKLESIWGLN